MTGAVRSPHPSSAATDPTPERQTSARPEQPSRRSSAGQAQTSAARALEVVDHVLPEHVGLEVDAIAWEAVAEIRLRERVRDQRDVEAAVRDADHRQRYAVDRHRPLRDEVARDLRLTTYPEPDVVPIAI